MKNLTMPEVEALWATERLIPLELAPIALWHLFQAPEPTQELVMPQSEEALGAEF